MDCRVSVIIPVYNAEKTLRRCVESLVLGQEREIEVILIEDYSKDASWGLCQALAEEFSSVVCVRNPKNSGVSYTRNQGLAVAKGEYILFVDSDDWVSERYVAVLLKLAAENPDSLPICGQHFIDKVTGAKRDYTWGGQPGAIYEVPAEHFFELSDRFLLQQLWNKVFRRDIIEKHHIRFDESQSMGEDFQFVLDYMEAAQIQKCVVLNEPLYYYIRWNNTSLMSKFGFIDHEPEFSRIAQLHRICGIASTQRRDEMIAQSKQNYVYHIVRSTNHGKQEKLDAIAQIIGDGQAQRHYRQQRLLQTKEKAAQLLHGAQKLPLRIRARFERKLLQKRIARMRGSVNAERFSIISQNCIGGVIYHDLGMQFLSPTINTFIPEPDFVKLVSNLRHYMEQDLEMRWEGGYPVGMLGDVQIHFMHYATCAEAKESWERRKARVDYDKILVLATDRDGFDEVVYEQWKKIPYPKVLFTANPVFTEDAVYFPEFASVGMVEDLISRRLFYRDGVLQQKMNAMN